MSQMVIITDNQKMIYNLGKNAHGWFRWRTSNLWSRDWEATSRSASVSLFFIPLSCSVRIHGEYWNWIANLTLTVWQSRACWFERYSNPWLAIQNSGIREGEGTRQAEQTALSHSWQSQDSQHMSPEPEQSLSRLCHPAAVFQFKDIVSVFANFAFDSLQLTVCFISATW